MNYYLLAFQKFAEFNGRATRAEYWYFFLFNMIVSYGLGFVAGMTESSILFGVYGIYALVAFIPSLAVAIRRMHDVGKSGWFILIPIYNLILAVTRGEEKDNQYGPNPYTALESDFV